MPSKPYPHPEGAQRACPRLELGARLEGRKTVMQPLRPNSCPASERNPSPALVAMGFALLYPSYASSLVNHVIGSERKHEGSVNVGSAALPAPRLAIHSRLNRATRNKSLRAGARRDEVA
jgi:hypothetical protein